MKEYWLIIICILGIFFLFSFFDIFKNPKRKIVVSIIAILAFTAIFVLELVKKRGIFDKEILLSFLLAMGLVIYLTMGIHKNYQEVNKTKL